MILQTKYLLFFLVFSIITGAGCKKRTTIAGVVTDISTGEPLENVKVYLHERNMGVIAGNLTGSKQWEQRTNVAGKFDFDIKARRQKSTEYIVEISQNEVLSIDTISPIVEEFYAFPFFQTSPSLDEHGANDLHFTAAPAARAIIIFENRSGKTIEKLDVTYNFHGEKLFIRGGNQPITSLLVDEVFPRNGLVPLVIESISGGISDVKRDTIRVKPFELMRHHITL